VTTKHLHGLDALNGCGHVGLLGRGEHRDGRRGIWDLKRGLSDASHGVLGVASLEWAHSYESKMGTPL
jgi:hypothetical protein